jgi:hypothetical protein
MRTSKLCYMSTDKLCYMSTGKLCYWSTSKLCCMSISKLGSPIMCVFIPRFDHPSILTHATSLPHHQPLAAALTSSIMWCCRFPRQPSPLTRGTTSTVGDNQPTGDAAASPARAAHPVLSSATTVGLLLFFRQLPTASSTWTQTAIVRGRRKAHGGLGQHQARVRGTVAKWYIISNKIMLI